MRSSLKTQTFVTTVHKVQHTLALLSLHLFLTRRLPSTTVFSENQEKKHVPLPLFHFQNTHILQVLTFRSQL